MTFFLSPTLRIGQDNFKKKKLLLGKEKNFDKGIPKNAAAQLSGCFRVKVQLAN